MKGKNKFIKKKFKKSNKLMQKMFERFEYNKKH
jgi:hypothetical protein